MRFYEASELADAHREVGFTDPAIVECKSGQIDDAALLFLTRRQAESASPPHKVIDELDKILNAARKLSQRLRESADPDYVLDEGHAKRAANRQMRMVSSRQSEKLRELGEPQLAEFIRCWYRDESEARTFDDALDFALQGITLVQLWAERAREIEERRKRRRKSRPTREADDALNELFARLIEISDYGPKTSEPSPIQHRQGKHDPYGPLIRYVAACLETLRERDPAIRQLTPGGIRGRIRRSIDRRLEESIL